ncbi:hypothetical protein FALBO_5771 [Fusarium albosuccineum]|uniref:Uncharacterized protein n=1 Tax=Fusarium albosuccineum TaxID=1237068 RepID=A0A8H4LGT4_9HYPO|nr:hypothetical protein FALBO_5771 [Fusarium albosuccineum]
MFVRLRRDGTVSHRLNRRSPGYKRPKKHEFFQASNLLLDLDDVFSEHVRPSNEDDEARMLKHWSVDPKRREVKSRLRQLQRELDRSRRQVFDVSSGVAKSWLPSHHDILSLALNGSQSPAPPSESSVEGHQGLASVSNTDTPGSREQPNTLHTIRSRSGIPERAQGNDEMLLHWFQLRNQLTRPEPHTNKPPPSPAQLVEALQKETSVTGIRRLVSRALSSGLDATCFSQAHLFVSSELQNSFDFLLTLGKEKNGTCHNLLAFLGNLSQRLSPRGAHIGAPLCGLGLRLSAAICKPRATMEYLDIGFGHGYWAANDQVMGDLLSTLETYLHQLSMSPGLRSLEVADKQRLLQLLTGVYNKDQTTEKSVRSLALYFLQERRDEVNYTRMALGIYRCYIVLLGHLGAVASLWQEWRSSGIAIGNLIQNGRLPIPDGQPDAIVVEAFQSAIAASLSVVALGEDEVPKDLDLAGCVTLDLVSINKQKQDARPGYQQEEAHPMRGFVDGDIRAALGLPLDGWLEEVRRLA